MGMSVIFIYMYMYIHTCKAAHVLLVDLTLIPLVCRVYTCTSVYKYSCTVYVQCTCTCKFANSCNHTLVVCMYSVYRIIMSVIVLK